MSLPRILTIMGSGETAPTMVSTHRTLTALLPKPVKAVLLDTPYGFQENAPELATRAVEYFRNSVNVDIAVAGLVRLHDTHIAADTVQIERGLRAISDATYIFAGPGSPTYALRQWSGSNVASSIIDKLMNGGIVTFASAAALTLGKVTVPVYEVYKVGQDVQRLDGLDVLSAIGINAAVIPHYDNAEGGNHDTRFCYLGETRLRMFEKMLDDDTYVLGIDEHTGLVIDLDASVAKVVGNGTVTLRLRENSYTYESGSTIPLTTLQNPWELCESEHAGTTQGTNSNAPGASGAPSHQKGVGISGETVEAQPGQVGEGSSKSVESNLAQAGSLEQELQIQQSAFNDAMTARDADGAVRACLALEQAIHDWSADTLQGDIADKARAAVRSMISALGDAAIGGVRNPRDVVAPYVEAMLAIRATVRAEKRYDLSDVIRDAFVNIGIEVRDTATGVEWDL
jgi:cyanophycinase-like exopeptidase